LAFKDGVLKMIAEVAHRLVDGLEPLVVANVVAD
jgi:hypothetical protein